MQESVRPPRQERSRRRVSALLDAAQDEFAERGFIAATTSGIADRAGVPIGSLYQWFPNKEALLYGLADRHLTEGAARMLDALSRAEAAPDLRTSVRTVVQDAVAINASSPELHRLLYHEAPRSAELRRRIAVLEGLLVNWVTGELGRRGVKHGAPSTELRARILVLTIDRLVHELAICPPRGATQDAVVNEIVTAAVAIAEA